jgi:hypothetical protein
MHKRLNTCSPAAASCAELDPVDAARAMTAMTQFLATQAVLIIFSIVLGCRARTGAASILATPVRMAFRPRSVNAPNRQFVIAVFSG